MKEPSQPAASPAPTEIRASEARRKSPSIPTDAALLTSARRIDEIIIHCAATRAGRDFHAADIRRWHRERGFADIGYHFVVTLDGTVEPGRPLAQTGAHCIGHNRRSIGICYVGGLDSAGHPADTRTPAQRASLEQLVGRLRQLYPGATVHGHREFAAKACPCFDARAEYNSL